MAGARNCWRNCRRCWAARCACWRRPASAAASRRRRRWWGSMPCRTRRRDGGRESGRRRNDGCGHGPHRLMPIPPDGGYQLLRDCVAGLREVEGVIGTLEASGLRGLGGAGFPLGRKWRIVRAEAGPRLMAINIDEGEPGTFKDRVLSRARPAPLPGRRADRRLGGRHRGHLYLPARRIPRLPRHAGGRAGQAARRSAGAGHAADSPAPRRRRVYLRRRVGHDRIDRRQARHAAPASALRGAGRPVRPPDAGTQFRVAALGARDPRARRRVVRQPSAATAGAACARSRSRAACATPA
jgi:hypothetical protein